jgi:ABC-type enterobactin transport system permease subunit
LGHLQKALETGFLTGLGVFIFSLFSHRWFSNKYIVAAITGATVFVADLIVHPSHFGGFATEAIVTGIFTAIISLTLNIAGKKLFLHAKDRISKD